MIAVVHALRFVVAIGRVDQLDDQVEDQEAIAAIVLLVLGNV